MMLERLLPKSGWLLSTVIALSFVSTGCSESEVTQASAPPAVPVKTQTIQSGSVQETSEFVGTLEAAQRVEVKAEAQGRIREIYVQSGDRVNQGTPLMRIQPDQAAPQLSGAQAQVQSARAARATAVQQREVAKAQVATAQSDVQLAETNYERASYLLNQGAIGAFQYDQAENNRDGARNRLQASQDQLKAAEVAIGQADAGIRAAQAQVESAQINLGFRDILAPIAGETGDLPIKVGDLVTSGQTVANLTQNTAMELRIAVPSNYANQLRTGLPVELIDPNTKQPLKTGSISFISPRVSSNVQTILAKARFANEGDLRDGQFVQARVIWKQNSGVLIPTTAISRIGGQSFVFKVEQEKTESGETKQVVQQTPVKLGSIQGDGYQVLEGVKPGDKIAVSNILRLRDGVPVESQS